MYIAYNGEKYPCECQPGETMVYTGLPEDFPSPIEGEITLCENGAAVIEIEK